MALCQLSRFSGGNFYPQYIFNSSDTFLWNILLSVRHNTSLLYCRVLVSVREPHGTVHITKAKTQWNLMHMRNTTSIGLIYISLRYFVGMIDEYLLSLCFPYVSTWADLLFIVAKSPYLNLGTLHFISHAETKTWCAVLEAFPGYSSQVVWIMLTKHRLFICRHAWIKTTALANAVNEHLGGDAVILCCQTTCCGIQTVKSR